MATASFGLLLAAAASYVSAAELFTDYMATPALGVGSAAPTLSWASEPTALAVAATTVTWQALNLSTGEFETTWSTVVPGSSRVEYGGPALVSDRAYRWAVDGDGTWAAVRTGLLDHSEWSAAGAVFLGTPARQNLLRLPFNGSATPGAPLRTASLFITGQSWFEVYLNGARADPLRFFEPAQSVYQSRIVYSTYDVTPLVNPSGPNVLGIVLGNGSCGVLTNATRATDDGGGGGGGDADGGAAQSRADNTWAAAALGASGGSSPARLGSTRCAAPRGDPACCCECSCCRKNPVLLVLRLTYGDGRVSTLASDGAPAWRCAFGPISFDDLYDGEAYDARLAPLVPAFSTPEFVAGAPAWGPALPLPLPLPVEIVPQRAPPERATAALRPVAQWQVGGAGGDWVLDFGQHLSGVVAVAIARTGGAPAPCAPLTLLHGELLWPNRSVHNQFYAGNVRMRVDLACVDATGGSGSVAYTPSFTYFGFRYVQIVGWPTAAAGPPPAGTFTALFVHTDAAIVGSFNSSNRVLAAVMRAALMSERSVLHSVPLDCPQRERHGWMGDAQVSMDSAIAWMRLEGFYVDYLAAIVATQKAGPADGSVPEIVPYVGELWDGGAGDSDPVWSVALPTIAWRLFEHTGDAALLAPTLNASLAYLEWMRLRAARGTFGGLLMDYSPHGDWICVEGVARNDMTPCHSVIASNYAYLTGLNHTARAAAALGDAATRAALVARGAAVAAAFVSRFLRPPPAGGPPQFGDATQLDLSTGLSAPVLDVLDAEGHADVGLAVLSGEAYPSFGWMLGRNATTIWESWKADTRLDSLNHAMYCSFPRFVFATAGGLRQCPGSVGWSTVCIRPAAVDACRGAGLRPDAVPEVVDAAVSTPRGRLAARSTCGAVAVAVPPGIAATVWVPSVLPADAAVVFEATTGDSVWAPAGSGERAAAAVAGVASVSVDSNGVIVVGLTAAGGAFDFRVRPVTLSVEK